MLKMLLSIFLLCFLLSGCGLKGPLYQPDNQNTALMFTSPLFYRIV